MDWFARGYVPLIIRGNFSSLHFHGEMKQRPQSLLVLSNHAGWWDPFFIIYANLRYFGKRYHVMMLEEELKARPLLRQAGAYSVKKNTRDAVISLDYTVELLRDRRNLVELFPQGKIESPLLETIRFQRGIDYVLERSPDCAVMLVACFTDYFSRRKPEAHVFLHTISPTDNPMAEKYNHFYHASRQQLIALHKTR